MNFIECKELLVRAGVAFEHGLSDSECSKIEDEFCFRFPPDLREFLAQGLPVSKGWVNWRDGSRAEIVKRLEWPSDGICFDIENNSFWLERWGPKPSALPEAFAIAHAAVGAAPRLIPVCGH